MKKKVKICHLTTVHSRGDTRIFVKECISLTKKFDVGLIVADGLGDFSVEGVKIYDVGKPKNRISRILFSTNKILKKAIEINAEIYHFHDPELLLAGKKLSKIKKVIYDVHEDVPRQILTKPYLPKRINKIISFIVERIEDRISRRFDLIITATDHIRDRFQYNNKHSKTLFNFPFLKEFEKFNQFTPKRTNSFCYIGAISKVRGVFEMVEAASLVKKDFKLGGSFQPNEFEQELKLSEGWKYVDYQGFLKRDKVVETMFECKVGLVTLHPTINYLDALPVKMFEYMAAGLPIVASNFPLWEEIINGEQCGLCVDPMNPKEIAWAIQFILDNPIKAEAMGKNGRMAVLNKYNWEAEEIKLLSYYEDLVSN